MNVNAVYGASCVLVPDNPHTEWPQIQDTAVLLTALCQEVPRVSHVNTVDPVWGLAEDATCKTRKIICNRMSQDNTYPDNSD